MLDYLEDDLSEDQKALLPTLKAFLEEKIRWGKPGLLRSREAMMILASNDRRHFETLHAWYLNPDSQACRAACSSRLQDLTHWTSDLASGKVRRRTLSRSENRVVHSFSSSFHIEATPSHAERERILEALNAAWGWDPDSEDHAPFGLAEANGWVRHIVSSFTGTVRIHKDGRSTISDISCPNPTAADVQRKLENLPSDDARLDFLQALDICHSCGQVPCNNCQCWNDE